jgi:hypothetical protein
MLSICLLVVIIALWRQFTLLKAKAKLKHLIEKVDIYVYCFSYYYNTSLCIPRAFMPMLDYSIFRIAGIAFRGGQCILRDSSRNVYYGVRKGLRGVAWKYDIGVAGMCPSGKSSVESILEEMEEEVGLEKKDLSDFSYIMTLTPYHGTSCIIDVFTATNYANKELKSHDDTYEYISTLDSNNILDSFNSLPIRANEKKTKKDTHILLQLDVFQ